MSLAARSTQSGTQESSGRVRILVRLAGRFIRSALLRLAPVERLLPTEGTDPWRVNKLVQDISAEGCINEPADVVQEVAVANGHTRREASHLLGLRHLPVLEHDPQELACFTWLHHFQYSLKPSWFLHNPPQFSGPTIPEHERLACTLVSLETGTCYSYLGSKDLAGNLAVQNRIYGELASANAGLDMQRIEDDVCAPSPAEWRKEFGARGTLLVYPPFNPSMLSIVANAKLAIGPGASRFRFSYRVKNLRIPLWLLASEASTEQKNRVFQRALAKHPFVSFDGEEFIPQGLDSSSYEEAWKEEA